MIEIYLLNALFSIVVIEWVVRKIRKYRAGGTVTRQTLFDNTFRYVLVALLIIGTPLLVFNFMEFGIPSRGIGTGNETFLWIASVGLSMLISGVWMMYIRKLDIFEVEKWRHVFAVFLLGVIFTFAAFPLYDLVHNQFRFTLNNEPVNDLLYSIFVIGGIEEAVKLIPVIIMLRFSGAVNEPYDYILYASIAALGFAFVENTLYIMSTDLYSVGARMLYASVAHMTFSSIIGYGLLLKKYRYIKKPAFVVYAVFFLLAIAVHGFYDFWLINGWARQFSFLTTIFFLITIHIWFTMKNNAINISNFFDKAIVLDNDGLKSFLVISLVSILSLSYVLVCVVHGIVAGNEFLFFAFAAFGYLVLYLILSFSRFRIIKGYLAPIHVPFSFFIPHPVIKKKNS